MDFLKTTSADNWFKQHPEKIAGVEYATTSFYFPIMVKGTKEDVLRVTGMSEPQSYTVVLPPGSTEKDANVAMSKLMAERFRERKLANRPEALNTIVSEGLKIKGITEVIISTDYKTIEFGTVNRLTNYSVRKANQSEIQEEYDFALKEYSKNKAINFASERNFIKGSAVYTFEEIPRLLKQLKQTEAYLEVYEKIIIPFYKFHLGINNDQPNKKLALAKAKAKALKIKLKLQ